MLRILVSGLVVEIWTLQVLFRDLYLARTLFYQMLFLEIQNVKYNTAKLLKHSDSCTNLAKIQTSTLLNLLADFISAWTGFLEDIIQTIKHHLHNLGVANTKEGAEGEDDTVIHLE